MIAVLLVTRRCSAATWPWCTPTARRPGDRVFLPVERTFYRICRVNPEREQRWTVYAFSLLAFSVVSFIFLYLLQRLQGVLPFNPTDMPAVPPNVSFNTAISFMTNTNWQAYSGEATMSHLTQMVGLAVQNFVSAAAGMAVMAALIRGLARRRASTLGNFWVDLTRTTTRILLPLSFVVAIILVSQGVIQNFHGFTTAHTLEGALQVDPRRARGQPGRDQAARHQRRRLLQHELRPPVRERHRRSATSSRSGRSLVIPFALAFTFGHMVGTSARAGQCSRSWACIWSAMSLGAMTPRAAATPS